MADEPTDSATAAEPLAVFAKILRGRVCVLGVGNRLRGDDGAGPCVIDALADTARAVCLDGGMAPENYAQAIVRAQPEVILIIDAADFGGRAGELRFFEATEISGGSFSTHAPSLALLCRYLQTATPARVAGVAIQPERLTLGEGLSGPVTAAVARLSSTLADVLGRP
jgi:hydrogenase 3 maturation protease